MDVVYILGNGSLAGDNEILYSLRSLERYMEDMGEVYVVGHCPKFLKNIHHVPADDPHIDTWKNTLYKTRKVCGLEELSDEFLLMNDDFFALRPFLGETLPFYAVLNGNGGPSGVKDFSIHAPIRFQKEWYEKMPLTETLPGQYSPRSFYCNFYGAPPTYTCDFVLRHGEAMPDYDTQCVSWPFFSISNSLMLEPEFEIWINDLYPEKSRFEK